MKAVVILGSPRKKDGYRLCRQIEAEMADLGGCAFDYIHLKGYHIAPCRGCGQCFQKSESLCPCSGDDLELIKEKMRRADGILFVSPVYAYQVPSDMKKLIDRLSYYFHRQELAGKPALLVTTTAGGGDKEVASYLRMTASGWGCCLSGSLRVKSPMYFRARAGCVDAYQEAYFQKKQAQLKAVAAKFYSAMRGARRYVPTFYDLALFQGLRSKTFTSQADYAYWKEKGWLDAPYFYPVSLGPVKTLYSRAVYAAVNHMCRGFAQENGEG